MNKLLLTAFLCVAASAYGATSIIYPGNVVAAGFIGGGTGLTNVASSGSASGSTQLGDSAMASGVSSLAVGDGASASGLQSTSVGRQSDAQNTDDTAFGFRASAEGTNSTAIGALATVANTHNGSTAIGKAATTTAAHQIMLGTSSEWVSAPGGFQSKYLAFTNTVSTPTSNSFWVMFGNSAGTTNHILQVVSGALNAYWCEGTNVYSKALAP